VVKDPTFPDPSLAKEVKDSSLAILHQFYSDSEVVWRSRAHLWGFPAGGALHLRKEVSFCFEEVRSTAKLFPEVISITIAPFYSSCWRISLADLFILVLGKFLKRGATFTEEALSWTPILLYMSLPGPDLHSGSGFMVFRGLLLGGRILEHFPAS
jgi:hypothetical protein